MASESVVVGEGAMEQKSCQSCRHWSPYPAAPTAGECGAIGEAPDVPGGVRGVALGGASLGATAHDESGLSVWLMTGRDFSCALWSGRAPRPERQAEAGRDE